MRYLFVVTLFFTCTKLLFSQAQHELSTSLILENDSLYAFDPWHIKIEITNIGRNSIKTFPISSERGNVNMLGLVDIEFLTEKDSVWQSTRQISNYHNEYGTYILSPPDLMIELKPNQIHSATFLLAPTITWRTGTFIKIRAVYFFPTLGNNIYSSVQSIYLKNYEESDDLAYQYLKSLPRPNFLFHPLYSVIYNIADIEYAEYIVEHFPNSKFSLYSKLFLTQTYLGKAMMASPFGKKEKDPDASIRYLRKCKFYGYSVLDSDETRFVKKSDEILRMMIGVIVQIYESEPPISLLQEFAYPPK